MSSDAYARRLLDAVDHAFGARGRGSLAAAFAAAGGGRRFEPKAVQTEYARCVARVLAMPASKAGLSNLAFFEAETGVGKTLGYMVPLALHIALGGGRGLVGTHTLQQLDRVWRAEAPIVAKLVEAQTGKRLAIAPRYGVRNFISPRRVGVLLDQREGGAKRLRALDDMLSFANTDTDAPGAGTLDGWLAKGGIVPEGVERDAVTFGSVHEAKGIASVERHLAAAAAADIVVTTHAMALMHISTRMRVLVGETDAEGFTAAVFDEADAIAGAAQAIPAARLTLAGLADALGDKGMSAASKRLGRWLAGARRYEPAAPPSRRRSNVWNTEPRSVILDEKAMSPRGRNDLRGVLADVVRGLSARSRSISRGLASETSRPARVAAKEALAGTEILRMRAVSLLAAVRSPHSGLGVPVLILPPGRKHGTGVPSLQLRRGTSARVMRRLFVAQEGKRRPHVGACVFTSATLDAPGTDEDPAKWFLNLRTALGRRADFEHVPAANMRKFAPPVHGRAAFVLADRDAPSPVGKRDTTGGTPKAYLDYVARGIVAARKEKSLAGRGSRRVYVLVPSYSDALFLSARLEAYGVKHSTQTPGGAPLRALLEAFAADPRAVLIVVGGWSGVDLPRTIDHLVIGRLPFAPPSGAQAGVRAAAEAMAAPSVGAKNASFAADQMAYRTLVAGCKRMLRQGIGRSWRVRDDAATVWILDPRFPVARERELDPEHPHVNRYPRHVDFAACIPERFRPAWRAARIFTVEGRLSP